MSESSGDELLSSRRRRRRRGPGWPVWLVAVAIGAILIATLLRPDTISDRERKEKTVRVVLPPPPPPPPPPPEIKPDEPPPEPKPVDQPTQTPPDAPDAPTPGDDALTAREGDAAGNFGLKGGDGSGTRIGGKAGGGDVFAAYGAFVSSDLRRALQQNKTLARAGYTVVVLLDIDANGQVQNVRLVQGTGDAKRDAAIRDFLATQRLSRPPPPDLPNGLRVEFTARPSV